MSMAASSIKQSEDPEEESATLEALMVEDDCAIYFCLEWDSYDIEHSNLTKFSKCLRADMNDYRHYLSLSQLLAS